MDSIHTTRNSVAADMGLLVINNASSCPRLKSNPNVLYNGHPMGTASGNDNSRMLNNTRATVAAFR